MGDKLSPASVTDGLPTLSTPNPAEISTSSEVLTSPIPSAAKPCALSSLVLPSEVNVAVNVVALVTIMLAKSVEAKETPVVEAPSPSISQTSLVRSSWSLTFVLSEAIEVNAVPVIFITPVSLLYSIADTVLVGISVSMYKDFVSEVTSVDSVTSMAAD